MERTYIKKRAKTNKWRALLPSQAMMLNWGIKAAITAIVGTAIKLYLFGYGGGGRSPRGGGGLGRRW